MLFRKLKTSNPLAEALGARLCLSVATGVAVSAHTHTRTRGGGAVIVPLRTRHTHHRGAGVTIGIGSTSTANGFPPGFTTTGPVVIGATTSPIGSAAFPGDSIGGTLPFSASTSGTGLFNTGGTLNSAGIFNSDGTLSNPTSATLNSGSPFGTSVFTGSDSMLA